MMTDQTDGPMSEAAATEPPRNPMDLAAAISLLDPENPDHWTADGKPKMAVLEEFTNGNLTRAEVEEAFPEFNRDTARAKDAEADAELAVPMVKTAEIVAKAKEIGSIGDKTSGAVPLSDVERIAALEADIAFLRKTLGWPTKE